MDVIIKEVAAQPAPVVAGICCAIGTEIIRDRARIFEFFKGYFRKRKANTIRSMIKRRRLLEAYPEERTALMRRFQENNRLTQDQGNRVFTELRNSVLLNDLKEIFTSCNVHEGVKFEIAIPRWQQESAMKIAEGSFGEVYAVQHVDASSRIIKCVQVDEQNLESIVPDIVCSTLLNELSNNDAPPHGAANFPSVYKICVVHDIFPDLMRKTQREYERNSNIDSEEIPRDCCEKFVTIEMEHCGSSNVMESLRNTWVAVSIYTQLVSALAVAEEAYCFEHRDLHLDNILIRNTNAVRLVYCLQDMTFAVDCQGHQLFVIDFSFSRISKGEKVYYSCMEGSSREHLSDEQEENWLDYESVYDMMSDILNGEWSEFRPETNVLWLKYILEHLVKFLQENSGHMLSAEFPDRIISNQLRGFKLLRKWQDSVLRCKSAKQLLLNNVLSVDNDMISILNRC